MTDATTAGILAADEVASKYKLAVWHAETWVCAGLMRHGYGKTRAEAVKDWAKGREPWPSVKAVQRWACEVDGAIGAAYTTQDAAEIVADIGKCGTVVPCEVVIRNEAETTP